MHPRLTLDGAVLFQQGGRARQGVRCCGGSWGDSRGACRHDRVTGRRVLTSIPVDLHIQEQLVLFNTPAEDENAVRIRAKSSTGITQACRLEHQTASGQVMSERERETHVGST